MSLISLMVIAVQFAIAFFLLTSIFNLVRIYNQMDKVHFYGLVAILSLGTGLTMYNVTDLPYLMARVPYNSIYGLAISSIVYLFSKNRKNELFTIKYQLMKESSKMEKAALQAIGFSKPGGNDSDKIEIVNSDTLREFIIGKSYGDKKTELLRLNPLRIFPLGSFLFKSDMLKGGGFGWQKHEDLDEELHVIIGMVKDTYTGKIYEAGDTIYWPAGTPHGLDSLNRSQVRAYLTPAK